MSPFRIIRFVRSTALLGALALVTTTFASAQAPQADNTKVNTRDREPGAVTADQQKNDAADRTITQKIRRSLMQDKGLSAYAHNVKIVSQNGQVTLKGRDRHRRRGSRGERDKRRAGPTEVVR
jgi:hyperosmotically inducible protein